MDLGMWHESPATTGWLHVFPHGSRGAMCLVTTGVNASVLAYSLPSPLGMDGPSETNQFRNCPGATGGPPGVSPCLQA
jgi:hypothetical protein